MLRIQKELESLKKKCNEKEFLYKRDEKIVSLEKQLEWFRSEAVNLSKINKELRNETESWKLKTEQLKEER